MDDVGCHVEQKTRDAEFLATFYSNFETLDERGKEVAIKTTKALVEIKRKRKVVDAKFVATFFPDFETLGEREKEVAIEVSKALIEKMRREKVRLIER